MNTKIVIGKARQKPINGRKKARENKLTNKTLVTFLETGVIFFNVFEIILFPS